MQKKIIVALNKEDSDLPGNDDPKQLYELNFSSSGHKRMFSGGKMRIIFLPLLVRSRRRVPRPTTEAKVVQPIVEAIYHNVIRQYHKEVPAYYNVVPLYRNEVPHYHVVERIYHIVARQ